jgi:hypothetical protein
MRKQKKETSMKYYIVILMIFFANFLSAANVENHKNRLYVNPSHIFFKDNKIFLLDKDQLYEISSIKTDVRGTYVKAKWPLPFFCQNCHRWSSSFTLVCEHCGAPRPE